jgi:hypothetical protein
MKETLIQRLKRWWGLYHPRLSFYLDIGIVQLSTHVWYEACEDCVTDYLVLQWRLFHWSGSFRLFRPWSHDR